MSKKEKLIRQIDILREKRKDWFNVLFALISAIVILVYTIVSGEKPIYLLIVAGLGLVASSWLAIYYKKIESDIETKLDDLEKED